RAARRAIDKSHLAKHAVGANALEHSAVGHDVDASRADDVHGTPLIVLNEDLLASRKALQREPRTRQQRKIQPGLRHGPHRGERTWNAPLQASAPTQHPTSKTPDAGPPGPRRYSPRRFPPSQSSAGPAPDGVVRGSA